jgi:hypothetical protein
MPHRSLHLCPWIAAACAVAVGATACAADVVVCDANTKPAPVVFAATEPRPVALAAKALARWLGEATGQPFAATALAAGAALPERAIVVGRMAATDLPDTGWTGFVVRTEGGRVRIAGSTDAGTRIGVYAFLEDDLGFRWWTHDEQHVPKLDAVVVREGSRVSRSPFRQHDLRNREAMLAADRLRTSGQNEDVFTGSHTLCGMLKPHADKHPEFLPTDDKSVRKFNKIHMNYTAPGMPEILAGELEKVMAKYGNRTDRIVYFAGMGDWYGGMDQTPASKEIYAEETWTDPDGRVRPAYSATLLRMINETARILEAKHPGVQVGTFAYMSLEAPPALTKPRDNVVIQVPRLRHCTVRSVTESPKNAGFRRNLERWCELAPGRVYVWEYGANYESFLVPFPCLYAIADNIKEYHRLGVAGVSVQGNYVSTGGDLAAVKNYVWRKILWDPTLDPRALVREFCEGYYGPAAPAIVEYVEALEEGVRGEPPSDADEFAKPGAFLSQPTREALRRAADRARGLVPEGDAVTRRRVEEAVVGLEALALTKPLPKENPFVEQDGRLYRTDMNGEYTFDRVVQMIGHLRGASPNEWGSGRGHHLNLLAAHGGPVFTVGGGPVTAKVAPAVNGRIGPFALGDRTVDITTTYGSPAGGTRTFERLESEPGTVRMRADAGVKLFGSSTKFFLTQSIDAAAGQGIRIRTDLRRVSREPEFERAAVRCITRFPKAEGLTVETRAAGSDAWTRVDLAPLIPPQVKGKPRKPPPAPPPAVFEGQAAVRVSADAWVFTDTFGDPAADPPTPVTVSVAVDPQTRGLVVTATGPACELSTSAQTRGLERAIGLAAR